MGTITVEIDIDDYLSEDEKKAYAIQAFKEQIVKSMFKMKDGRVSEDEAVRLIGNISHGIVFEEVQKYIPDFEAKIKENVKKILGESKLLYHVFKKKDAWDREESLAVTYMNEAVRESRDVFKERIKKVIANYDVSTEVSAEISNSFYELADTMSALSELFHAKSEDKV